VQVAVPSADKPLDLAGLGDGNDLSYAAGGAGLGGAIGGVPGAAGGAGAGLLAGAIKAEMQKKKPVAPPANSAPATETPAIEKP